jgi:hypothetical protein
MGIGHSQELLAEPIRIWEVSEVYHVAELIGYNNLQDNVVGSVLNTQC